MVGGLTMASKKIPCNMDCFNCIHDDCINDVASLLDPVECLELGHTGSVDTESDGFAVLETEVHDLPGGLCDDNLVMLGLSGDDCT